MSLSARSSRSSVRSPLVAKSLSPQRYERYRKSVKKQKRRKSPKSYYSPEFTKIVQYFQPKETPYIIHFNVGTQKYIKRSDDLDILEKSDDKIINSSSFLTVVQSRTRSALYEITTSKKYFTRGKIIEKLYDKFGSFRIDGLKFDKNIEVYKVIGTV